MNPIDRNKIWKMVGILALITVVAGGLLRVSQHSSYTLGDYAADNPSLAYQTAEPSPTPEPTPVVDNSNENATENLQEGSSMAETTVLTGYSLNGELLTDQRTTLSDGFYYEPLSEKLQRYITGVSYPVTVDNSDSSSETLLKSVEISYDDLRYVHIRHYNFEGNPAEGELICNKAIAQDLTEIFYELYCNEYQLEKVLLIDEYNGDDTASMEMLVFARVLGEAGPYLKEGVAVLAEGRISVRDEKAPQLMCDRVRPLDQVKGNLPPVEGEERAKKLYIRIPSLDDPRWERIKLVLTMFPGTEQMVVKCEDTGKRLGTVCLVHPALIQELNELLGAENVVVR